MMPADARAPASCRARGFTLIEVLIALAFLALAMSAIIATVGVSIRDAGELRDKTFAHWVAMNEMTTLRLAPAWPTIGTQKGNTEMAGQKWNWQAIVSTSQDPDLLRVDIDVSNVLSPDTVSASLVGFIGRPLPQVPGSMPTPQGNQGGTSAP
ncbi:MAG: type II secretion system minor pseudopilin GspI [Gammaproteobacteria bacterium]|nr:type II secretion system minor pseudopilin GspI [Gammaproteobacteria bacterium]MDE1887115.1 type II secretion system minor pseudopilin GspI [Gammaproteobacteria bacterium]MDE2022776.1 type II secretion system minor pseudopilin GspI [Gammaproteobacteria bacterium]